MSLRNWINEHSAVAAAIVIVVLAVALTTLYFWSRPAEPKAWYFDTGTGRLFDRAPSRDETVTAPSGQVGVMAYVFGCGGCGKDQLKVGYLEKISPEARRAMGDFAADTPDDEMTFPGGAGIRLEVQAQGHLVADPQDQIWVSRFSEEGEALMVRAQNIECPPGQTLRPCLP